MNRDGIGRTEGSGTLDDLDARILKYEVLIDVV